MAYEWLPAALSLGSGLFNAYNQDRGGNNYVDALKAREDKNYADTKAYNDAYAQYVQQANAARAANAGIAASNANAAAAAAAATEKNRQKAARKALKFEKKNYGERIGMFEPYRQAGLQLLPQMQKTYEGGMNNVNMLNAYLNTPGQLQKLNQAVLPQQTGIQLPSYLRGGAK